MKKVKLKVVSLYAFLRRNAANGIHPDTKMGSGVSPYHPCSEVLVKKGCVKLSSQSYKKHCESFKHFIVEKPPTEKEIKKEKVLALESKLKLPAGHPDRTVKNFDKTPRLKSTPAVASNDFLSSYEWRRLRMQALKLHGAQCQCCGATPATGAVMNVDHIKPRKLFRILR
jgi:hypothetical protein